MGKRGLCQVTFGLFLDVQIAETHVSFHASSAQSSLAWEESPDCQLSGSLS